MSLHVFLIALGAPFLWALVNHSDKYLISKFFGEKQGGIGGLMIFSTLFSVVLLPFIFWKDSSVFSLSFSEALILIAAGVAYSLGVLFYFYALEKDEASIVVPFMQLIPVFAFIFSYTILGEIITTYQIIGGLVIILGASLISFKFHHQEGQVFRKIRFRTVVVILMIMMSAMSSLYLVLFKLVSLQEGFWSGTFWLAIGAVLVGLVLICIPAYRQSFIFIFRKGTKLIVTVNCVSELMTILGNWLTAYAGLFAPVVLVNLVAGFQPIFAFVLGVLTTIFFPKIAQEDISKSALVQKISAMMLIGIGTYMLF